MFDCYFIAVCIGFYQATMPHVIRPCVSSADLLFIVCFLWVGSVRQSSDVIAGHSWTSNKVDKTESCQQQSADTAARDRSDAQ